MQGIFSSPPFTGFGPSRFLQGTAETLTQLTAPRLRSQVRRDCPQAPGVYGMLDAFGDLIYVGKAKRLRQRLLSYFRPRSRDPKAGRILSAARSLVWETAPSEFVALLRELELIHRWQPLLNVQGQPRRRRPVYVCLGRAPAPYAFLSSRPCGSTLRCFGPLPASHIVREAVRFLNDAFQLRDCPQPQTMRFADQAELFPIVRAAGCLRHDIGTCLGPCAGACSSGSYQRHAKQASEFLLGRDFSLLGRLESDMRAAARDQAFERAAHLRTRLEALRWLTTRLERLRDLQAAHSFVYPIDGTGRPRQWYVIHRGFVETVLPAPADAATCRTSRESLQRVFCRPARSPAPAPAERLDEMLLVLSWFRKHPGELERTLAPAEALALCRPRVRDWLRR